MSNIIPEDRHRQVLKKCIDVPEEAPAVPLQLQKVGISGKTVWIRLVGNSGGHLPFSAAIHVNLASDRRGIHMSRIEQAITSLYDEEFTSLPEYGQQLASLILQAQKAQFVSVELSGSLPFIQEAPVSRLKSIDSLGVIFKTELKKNRNSEKQNNKVGVEVYHLTACPCTLAYNEALFDRPHDPSPQSTHSQRSKTRLLVSLPEVKLLPAYPDLAGILGSVLHLSHDLLKRPDETELVLKAHCCPQFAEDTVREVARAAGEKFRDSLPTETRILVYTLSLESIHLHDVECFLDMQLGDIVKLLQAAQKERAG